MTCRRLCRAGRQPRVSWPPTKTAPGGTRPGLVLAFVLGAWQRLEVARPLDSRGRGELPKERLAFKDAVPVDFGELVSVTASSDHPAWAQAWFVRPDKSIVIVWVNTRTGNMLGDAVVIPRR